MSKPMYSFFVLSDDHSLTSARTEGADFSRYRPFSSTAVDVGTCVRINRALSSVVCVHLNLHCASFRTMHLPGR